MASNEIINFEKNENLSMVQVQNICLKHRLTPMDAAYEINQKLKR
jgi:hypothetical protein